MDQKIKQDWEEWKGKIKTTSPQAQREESKKKEEQAYWDQTVNNEEFQPKNFNKWIEWDQRNAASSNQTSIVPTTATKKLSSMMSWNTKSGGEYQLRHYNYFQNSPEIKIELSKYLKFNESLSEPPKLKFYMRFYPQIYESELNERYKSSYASLMEDELGSENLIYNKTYKGLYSKQLDYFKFKQEQMQNIKAK